MLARQTVSWHSCTCDEDELAGGFSNISKAPTREVAWPSLVLCVSQAVSSVCFSAWFPRLSHCAHAQGKAAVQNCSRCRWLKHRTSWQSTCSYQTPELRRETWLIEQPNALEPFGLGCSVCRSARLSACSPYVLCRKGTLLERDPALKKQAVLQIEDLKNHAKSHQHLQSLGRLGQQAESRADGNASRKPDTTVPTPAQIRLAIEVVREARSAQGDSYKSRAELARRNDEMNYPLAKSTRSEHSRIISAVAATLRDGDRDLHKRCLAAGWAEARRAHPV